jgi:hypothetical protein
VGYVNEYPTWMVLPLSTSAGPLPGDHMHSLEVLVPVAQAPSKNTNTLYKTRSHSGMADGARKNGLIALTRAKTLPPLANQVESADFSNSPPPLPSPNFFSSVSPAT